eukprot:TRINITY_DN11427_c0_g1_i1.p2 TRINITY_DN11427_c0_g1~~TRINITY_DN11427_c0_g1_i1.p2  ORF type:complete len:238 (+),score=70.39 TRINITY_DN11427_c0_g1_i1:101-715(+)
MGSMCGRVEQCGGGDPTDPVRQRAAELADMSHHVSQRKLVEQAAATARLRTQVETERREKFITKQQCAEVQRRAQAAIHAALREADEKVASAKRHLELRESLVAEQMAQLARERQAMEETTAAANRTAAEAIAAKLHQESLLERFKKETQEPCVICMEDRADTFLRPCRHLYTCKGCTDKLWANGEFLCPMCRDPVASYEQLFR